MANSLHFDSIDGSSLAYCTNQTKRLMEKLKKKKAIEQSSVRKGSGASPWREGCVRKGSGVSPWREGCKENVPFEFRVKQSRSDGKC